MPVRLVHGVTGAPSRLSLQGGLVAVRAVVGVSGDRVRDPPLMIFHSSLVLWSSLPPRFASNCRRAARPSLPAATAPTLPCPELPLSPAPPPPPPPPFASDPRRGNRHRRQQRPRRPAARGAAGHAALDGARHGGAQHAAGTPVPAAVLCCAVLRCAVLCCPVGSLVCRAPPRPTPCPSHAGCARALALVTPLSIASVQVDRPISYFPLTLPITCLLPNLAALTWHPPHPCDRQVDLPISYFPLTLLITCLLPNLAALTWHPPHPCDRQVDLPIFYGNKMRRKMKAGAGCEDLRVRCPHYYSVATRLHAAMQVRRTAARWGSWPPAGEGWGVAWQAGRQRLPTPCQLPASCPPPARLAACLPSLPNSHLLPRPPPVSLSSGQLDSG